MSGHMDSAERVLRYLKKKYKEIEIKYNNCEKYLDITDDLLIESGHYLQSCRSVFDYCAKEVARYTGKEGDTYFPFFKASVGRDRFSEVLQAKFPNLEKNHNKFFLIFERFQHFNSNSWVTAMVDITNDIKHVKLHFQHMKGCEALVIVTPDGPKMQLGDRGMKEIILEEETSVIKFEQKNGRSCCIRGPQKLSVETQSLSNADSEISLVKLEWLEIKFDVYSEQPARIFLAKAAIEANYLYFEIAKLIGRTPANDLEWPLRLP